MFLLVFAGKCKMWQSDRYIVCQAFTAPEEVCIDRATP